MSNSKQAAEISLKRIAVACVMTCNGFATTQAFSLVPAHARPTNSGQIVIGSAPGCGSDDIKRAVPDRLAPLVKQPVVMKNSLVSAIHNASAICRSSGIGEQEQPRTDIQAKQ